MSELLTIFDALADYPIYLNGKIVNVWRLGESKNAAERTDLPLRIQLPAGTDGGNAPITPVSSFAKQRVATTTWTLTELFLYQAKGQGKGTADPWRAVTEFLASYLDMLVNKQKITKNITVDGWNPSASEIVWPLGANRAYYGALIRVSFEEYLCPCLSPNCK